MTQPTPKPWIAAIEPYVPGKATAIGAQRVSKLSSNENPLGPSPRAIAAMAAVAGDAHRYPDGASTALREAIGAAHGLEADRIVCGTGSDELLHLVANAYAGAGDEILFPTHAFMTYPIATRRVGATPVEAPVTDYAADVDALLARVTPRTRVVYLANPDNPKSTMIAGHEVRRLHAALPGDVVLVVDSAYAEYVEDPVYEDGAALAREADNVLMTRTFSKIHGLAAERIGWAYGHPAIIDALNRIRGPFNVTTAGQAGAIAAIGDTDWVERSRAHNTRWRGWLVEQVGAMGNTGLRAVPSAANFVLITFAEGAAVTAQGAYQALAAQGYLTRWLPGLGLGHAIRISIGTEAETRGVAAALHDYVEAAASHGHVEAGG